MARFHPTEFGTPVTSVLVRIVAIFRWGYDAITADGEELAGMSARSAGFGFAVGVTTVTVVPIPVVAGLVGFEDSIATRPRPGIALAVVAGASRARRANRDARSSYHIGRRPASPCRASGTSRASNCSAAATATTYGITVAPTAVRGGGTTAGRGATARTQSSERKSPRYSQPTDPSHRTSSPRPVQSVKGLGMRRSPTPDS